MIKARSGNNVILGIDEENVKRLQDKKPIMVKGSDLGIDQDIFIIYGKTPHDIQKDLKLKAKDPGKALEQIAETIGSNGVEALSSCQSEVEGE